MRDAKSTGVTLANGDLPVEAPIRIGCAGWNIPKQFAKHAISTGSHLERYSHLLNCSEINSSFYRPHRNTTWQRWRDSVPTGFRFSVKMPRTITHEAKLNCDSQTLSLFLEQVRWLGDKLGPILMQLPPSLQFDSSRARSFLSLLRQSYAGELVCEPRHPGWFDPEVDELLAEFRVGRVAADPACVPAASRPAGDGSVVYYRLHGSPQRYYSAYSDDFLRALAAQMKEAASRSETWCIFDNTASGAAFGNARHLAIKLKHHCAV
jgi:uncharacterized protein YecE (DUF72 family)